ncbi:MAG: YfhO family protein [Bacteroidota bacterium]|nr:YfhO family protein [Bacteroidota bacterium]
MKKEKMIQKIYVPEIKDWHVIILLTTFVVFFFREIIFQQAFFWEDFIYQFYPYRNFASVSFANGEIPLWNPYTFVGMPFLADITGTVLYLPHLLLIPFASGGILHVWYVEMYLLAHVVLAGVTMYYLAKYFSLSKIPATFSALAYMLSGFMIVHMIHLVIICQIAWFPLAVLLFVKTLREFSIQKMILCGFVLFLIVCGGHIQISFYFFIFLFILFIVEIYHRIRQKGDVNKDDPIMNITKLSLLAAGVVVIAVALSAIQLLPTMELTKLSVREELSFTRSTEGELWWQQLITILIPKFFGEANHPGSENPNPFWGPESYWNYWETCIYTGITALILALFALKYAKSNRHLMATAWFALFAILYALGDNFILHRLFYDYVPGFDKFRSLGRWGFFFIFAVALLSGYGLQNLLNIKSKDKYFKRVLFAIGGTTLLLTIIVHLQLADQFISDQLRSGTFSNQPVRAVLPIVNEIVRTQSLISMVVVFVSLIVLYLFFKKSINIRWILALIFLVQFFDMYIFGYKQNNGTTDPEKYFRQRSEIIEQWKQEGKSEFFRINMRQGGMMLVDRNQGMMDRIFLIEGYSQLGLQRRYPPTPHALDMMNVKYRMKLDTVLIGGQPRIQAHLVTDTTYLPRAFFVYNYKSFLTVKEESLYIAGSQFNPKHEAVFLETPQIFLDDTISTSQWNAKIVSYTINSITLKVSTPKKGILVLSEMYYPDWNAYVDDLRATVYRADWSLRALVVEAGDHTVEMKYEPKSFYRGAAISGGTLVLCILGYFFSIVKRRKSNSSHLQMSKSI